VVAFDFGIKRNILRLLSQSGCRVTVVPATTSATEVRARKPDGVFLSNGPGDPAAVGTAILAVRELTGTVPLFGICLGHQILGLALGGTTFKLKFGHRGSNHPVRDEETGRVMITAQNHGFSVDPTSLPEGVRVTHVNLNDQTCEGFVDVARRAYGVQFHPEASPGPEEAQGLFGRFFEWMRESHQPT